MQERPRQHDPRGGFAVSYPLLAGLMAAACLEAEPLPVDLVGLGTPGPSPRGAHKPAKVRARREKARAAKKARRRNR